MESIKSISKSTKKIATSIKSSMLDKSKRCDIIQTNKKQNKIIN